MTSLTTAEKHRRTRLLMTALADALEAFGRANPGTTEGEVLSAVATVYVNLLSEVEGPTRVAPYLRSVADETERQLQAMGIHGNQTIN